MSLRRRLLIYLLVCAPLVWAVALFFSVDRARHEVNELFDTGMIRLARQVQATLSGPVSDQISIGGSTVSARRVTVQPAGGDERHVWIDAEGRVLRVEIPARRYVAVRSALP